MELAEERKAFKAHMEQEDVPSVQEKEMVNPDVEIEDEATQAMKRYGSEEEPGQIKRRRSARLAEKRRRAEEAQEEQEAEEQMVRGTIDLIVKEKFEGRAAQEGQLDPELVDSVHRPPDTGPPWYDDVTGEPLEDDAVRAAMKKEMESMANFEVFEKVPEKIAYDDPNAIIVGSRWVRIRKADGRTKCRLVAQQINHGEKMDTYAATASSVGARLLLAIATERRRRGEHCTLVMGDVSTAFLHASWRSKRPTFIVPPASEAEEGVLWKVKKALYGLRESPRLFQEFLSDVAENHGWVRLRTDPQLFCHASGALMSVFADDILLLIPNNMEDEIKRTLDIDMKIKWGEYISKNWVRYLGKEWKEISGGHVVRVPLKYWASLFEEAGLENARPTTTPMDLAMKEDSSSPRLDPAEHAKFRRWVGKVLYTTQVRPDISYAIKELARNVAAPTQQHMRRMQHLLRYIKGTQDYVLKLGDGIKGADADEVTVLVDANWAEAPSRRSTSGGCVYYNGYLLLTYSRTQPVVALSTCEAELLALCTGTSEGKFVVSILHEMGVEDAHLRILSDSSAARAVVIRRGPGRMKHLDIRYLWMQEGYRNEEFQVAAISTANNWADALTKGFAGPRHRLLTASLGLTRLEQ